MSQGYSQSLFTVISAMPITNPVPPQKKSAWTVHLEVYHKQSGSPVEVEATPEAPTEKESPEVSADTETKALGREG